MDEDDFIKLESGLIDAMKVGDVGALDEMLHDDLLFAIPNGQTVTKEMDLGNFKQGFIVLDELTLEDAVVSLIGDNAIIASLIYLAGKFHDQPFQGHFKYLRIWKSFDDRWKVIGGAGIHIQPPNSSS